MEENINLNVNKGNLTRILTQHAYRGKENCRELFYNTRLHGLAWRHFDLFGDVSFHFHNVRRCNVVLSLKKIMKHM